MKYKRMKHKYGTIVGALLFTHQPVFADNEAIASYVCEGEVLFEESLSQQPTVRLHTLQGAYRVITEREASDPILERLYQGLAQANIKSACHKVAIEFNHMDSANDEVIARIYFDFDSSNVNNKDKRLLSRLHTLIESTHGEFVIEGHTDNKGSEEYNWALGLKRSQEIAQYLPNSHVHSITSMGETSPIKSNRTEFSRQKNRRVEIKRHE